MKKDFEGDLVRTTILASALSKLREFSVPELQILCALMAVSFKKAYGKRDAVVAFLRESGEEGAYDEAIENMDLFAELSERQLMSSLYAFFASTISQSDEVLMRALAATFEGLGVKEG